MVLKFHEYLKTAKANKELNSHSCTLVEDYAHMIIMCNYDKVKDRIAR